MRVQILFVAFLVISCAVSRRPIEDMQTPARLNAERHLYDGSRVKVRGWMHSHFESYALWESRQASDEGDYAKNCVSLMIPESMETSRFDGRYVEVEGMFLARVPSVVVQLGACNITTLQLLEDRQPVVLGDE